MPAKRKATDSQKLDRVYRRQVAMDRKLERTMKTLADDFTRVLRQNDTLRGENDTLKAIIDARETVVGGEPSPISVTYSVPPVLTHAIEMVAAHMPSAHVFDDGKGSRRCVRCHCLKEAVDASGTPCI
jgi:hypothetical protein